MSCLLFCLAFGAPAVMLSARTIALRLMSNVAFMEGLVVEGLSFLAESCYVRKYVCTEILTSEQ